MKNLCSHPYGFDLTTIRDGYGDVLSQYAECVVCGESRPADQADPEYIQAAKP